MLRIFNKFIPELKGCRSFDFETKHEFRGYTRLTKIGLEAQHAKHDHIRALLKQYSSEPCEVHLCVGLQKNHTFSHGVVWLYDHKPECFRSSGLLFQAIDQDIGRFLETYPESEFMIYYSQSVTITQIIKN